MREYVVERTNIESQWLFERMIPSLPGPGSAAFAKLVKELHPLGLLPADISVETPTARLADIALVIQLLDRRVGIRVTPAGIEFNVSGVFVDDDEKLGRIANAIVNAVREIDEDAAKARVNVRISSHLKVTPDADNFLSEHLLRPIHSSELTTEAVVLRVNPEELTATEARAVIAKSLVFSDAIFFDLNVSYTSSSDVSTLIKSVNIDFDRILLHFGLVESEVHE